MTASPWPRRAAWAATGVTAALVLAACGGAEPDQPAGAPDRTKAPAKKAGPSKKAFDAFGPEFGAIGTILIYCTPGLPGSPRDGCDLGRIRKGVTELTAGLAKKLDTPAGAGTYPRVASAVDRMKKANGALESCGDWYASGGDSGSVKTRLACDEAWNDLHHHFRTVTAAAGYGRKG